MRQDEEKKMHSTISDPEVAQMIELAEKNIKSHYNCIPYVQEFRAKADHVTDLKNQTYRY